MRFRFRPSQKRGLEISTTDVTRSANNFGNSALLSAGEGLGNSADLFAKIEAGEITGSVIAELERLDIEWRCRTLMKTIPQCLWKTTAKAGELTASGGAESITSRAYARLRSDIMSGQLQPGRKLKIDELRKLYDVGTSPIREALSLLTSDKFVERIDQRGFRVATVSLSEFRRTPEDPFAGWKSGHCGNQLPMVQADGKSKLYLLPIAFREFQDQMPMIIFVANAEWEERHKHFHMTLISASGSLNSL